jgi:hypothetical protein
LCALEVDDQIIFRGVLDGQIGAFGSPRNPIDIFCGSLIHAMERLNIQIARPTPERLAAEHP